MSGRQVIERVFDAPIGLIWELWTSVEGVASWFGPRGFEVEVLQLELRPGGAFNYSMTATDPEMVKMMQSRKRPTSHTISSTFTIVEAPNKLAYDSPWGEDMMTTEVTFTEVEQGVKMVLVIDATRPEMTGGAAMGWKSSLQRLAERLSQ